MNNSIVLDKTVMNLYSLTVVRTKWLMWGGVLQTHFLQNYLFLSETEFATKFIGVFLQFMMEANL